MNELSRRGFVPPKGEGGGTELEMASPLGVTSCQGGGASGKVTGLLVPQELKKIQQARQLRGKVSAYFSIMQMEVLKSEQGVFRVLGSNCNKFTIKIFFCDARLSSQFSSLFVSANH